MWVRFPAITAILAAIALGSLTSCGGSAAPRVISVPADSPTIQAAVDGARPGDTILIAPGTYREAVTVDVDDLLIRGEDRNDVILDGDDALSNGFLVSAHGVRIENLTVHSFTQNGVVFNGIIAATNGKAVDPNIIYGTEGNALVGFGLSHVTSYNNGLYGI